MKIMMGGMMGEMQMRIMIRQDMKMNLEKKINKNLIKKIILRRIKLYKLCMKKRENVVRNKILKIIYFLFYLKKTKII